MENLAQVMPQAQMGQQSGDMSFVNSYVTPRDGASRFDTEADMTGGNNVNPSFDLGLSGSGSGSQDLSIPGVQPPSVGAKGSAGTSGGDASASASAKGRGKSSGKDNKFWKCGECGNINYSHRQTCNLRKCGAPRVTELNQSEQTLPTVIEESNRNRKEMLMSQRMQMGAAQQGGKYGAPAPGSYGMGGGYGQSTSAGSAASSGAGSMSKGMAMGSSGPSTSQGQGQGGKGTGGKRMSGTKGNGADAGVQGQQGQGQGQGQQSQQQQGQGQGGDDKVSGWICAQCSNFNYENRRTCNMRICSAPRPRGTALVYWTAQEIEDYKVKKKYPTYTNAAAMNSMNSMNAYTMNSMYGGYGMGMHQHQPSYKLTTAVDHAHGDTADAAGAGGYGQGHHGAQGSGFGGHDAQGSGFGGGYNMNVDVSESDEFKTFNKSAVSVLGLEKASQQGSASSFGNNGTMLNQLSRDFAPVDTQNTYGNQNQNQNQRNSLQLGGETDLGRVISGFQQNLNSINSLLNDSGVQMTPTPSPDGSIMAKDFSFMMSSLGLGNTPMNAGATLPMNISGATGSTGISGCGQGPELGISPTSSVGSASNVGFNLPKSLDFGNGVNGGNATTTSLSLSATSTMKMKNNMGKTKSIADILASSADAPAPSPTAGNGNGSGSTTNAGSLSALNKTGSSSSAFFPNLDRQDSHSSNMVPSIPVHNAAAIVSAMMPGNGNNGGNSTTNAGSNNPLPLIPTTSVTSSIGGFINQNMNMDHQSSYTTSTTNQGLYRENTLDHLHQAFRSQGSGPLDTMGMGYNNQYNPLGVMTNPPAFSPSRLNNSFGTGASANNTPMHNQNHNMGGQTQGQQEAN